MGQGYKPNPGSAILGTVPFTKQERETCFNFTFRYAKKTKLGSYVYLEHSERPPKSGPVLETQIGMT